MVNTSISQELDSNGILTVVIDMPGRSMNVVNGEMTVPLKEVIECIVTDAAVKGAVLTSGKRDFVAGGDIEMLFRLTKAEEAFNLVRDLQLLLRRLETCGKPVVAAMPGTALGGGLELALACHYRVALNNPKAKYGLPEVKLGLLPGGGGTQRLSRLLGIQASLSLMLEGTELGVQKAHEAGIINAVAETPEDLIRLAKEWIQANPAAQNPWDKKGYKYPGGDARSPAVGQMLAVAPVMVNKKTHGNYPAPLNILSSVVEGSLVDIDTGMKIEARYFAELAVSQVAKNTIGSMWNQLNAINRGESRPKGFDRFTVKKVGVLGAGMMGAGVAYVSAKAGMEVILKDVSLEAAERGKAYSEKILDKSLEKGRITEVQKIELLGRIKATAKAEDLEGCDFVIEAVFEDRDLKAQVTRETEAVMDKGGVFGSNTSTLPITGLAKASARPDKFVGVHFFSPVEKMPLVEIIVGQETSQETLARAFDYVQQIKKTPIVVNDSRGFYTSRVFATYVLEGIALLVEGQNPVAIENAGLQAGMPVAPLALQDEVALSLSLHVTRQTKKDMEAEGKPYIPHPSDDAIEKMVDELGRAGKKARKGFYEYPESGRKYIWPELTKHFPLAEKQMDAQEMMDRLMFIQANEAARCFEEGVVTAVADANIGSIFGWGFAPHQGGALQFINAYGVGKFVERGRVLHAKYGDRFKPAAILEKMAAEGKTF